MEGEGPKAEGEESKPADASSKDEPKAEAAKEEIAANGKTR